jgi:hypothetical protein
MGAPSGQGSSFEAKLSTLKFLTGTENYKILRISPVFEREVAVIDNGDLSQAAGTASKTCPGDIVRVGQVTAEVEQDFEDTTRFRDQIATAGIVNPLPIGLTSGTATTAMFHLYLGGGSATGTNRANVMFSGFVQKMSGFGIEADTSKRVTEVLTIQPDGDSIVWTAKT